MTTVIRAAGAADFLALVPRLLGFLPECSLVLVPFAGNRTLGALRLDLPDLADTAELDRFASTFIGMVCKVANADAVAAVVFTDTAIAGGESLPHDLLVRALLTRADLCGLRGSEALCLAPDGWGSYLDPATPPGGHPLADIPFDHEALADLPLTRGDQGAGAELPDVGLAEKERVGRALRRLESALRLARCGDESDEPDPDAAVAAGAPDAPDADAFLGAYLLGDPPALFEDALWWHPDELLPAQAAALTWALARPALRDIALVQWAGDQERGDEALDAQLVWNDGAPYPSELATTMWGDGPVPDPDRLLAALTLVREVAARAPRELRPGPLSACAWLAWALGRSTHAARYATTACEIEPDHGMAGIMLAFVNSAHLPEWAYERPAPPDIPVTRLVDSAGVES